MATIALPRGKQLVIDIPSFSFGRNQTKPFSTLAFASVGCLILFLAFIIAYQTAAFENMTTVSKTLLSGMFVIIAPALAFIFSVLSLRRYVKDHNQVSGMIFAYISFIVSSIYIVTALAMPLLLLGMYVVYVYIW